ncbi:hypothetical protein KY289_023550 [Solanum tuberosum]|nr:hypothetical protein KY289_023550 [Solanum tuberosum]
MDAFEQSNVTEFLNLIQSVTSQAWLVIYSLYRDIKKEGIAREIGWSHFQLFLKFSMLKFSTIVSSDSPKMDLVLMGALKLIEPEETLMDMLNKATLKAPMLDMVESAHEELIFLRAFLMDVLRQQMKLNKYHHLLRNVEETANKLAQVSRFRNERFMDENSTWEVLDASLCNMTLPDIEGLINFLSNRLDIVLDCDAGSISFLMNRSRVLKEELMYLGYFVADVVQHYNMHQGLKDLMKHVLDTKYVCLLSIGGNLEELLCSKLDSVIDWKHQIGSVKEGILCLRDHFAENFDELDEVYGFVLKVTESRNIKLLNKVVAETYGRKEIDVTVHKVAKRK